MSHGTVNNGKSNGKEPVPRETTVGHHPPPDGGWGWMVVFASFCIHVITDGMTYSFGVFHETFLTYFNGGQAMTAWIVSTLVGVTLSAGPISSIFVNRYGCRKVTVVGALLAAVCVMASALADSLVMLIFTIGVGAGLGFGLIYLAAIVSVTVWFEKRRSLATGIAVCGSGFGTFVFAPLTSYLISNFGWRGAMLIIGAVLLNSIPCGLMFRPVPQPEAVTEPMVPKAQKMPLIRSQSSEQVTRANESDDNDVSRLTLSQSALNDSRHKRQRTVSSTSNIMEKPDILYQGSMPCLSKFRAGSPEPSTHAISVDKDRCDCLPCSPQAKSTLAKMFDTSLFVDPVFILFTVSNFLTSVGYYIPYVYTVPMAKELNIPNPPYLISIIGAANLVGRILLGYISDLPWVNRLWAYNICLTVAGISTGLAIFFKDFWGMAIYAAGFGFCIGAYVGLTSVVLVDLLGLDKLTNAFGLLLLFQGIASLLGPPFAGWSYDVFASYTPVFLLAAVAISLSGLILFFIPMLERRVARRRELALGMDLDQI